MCSLDLIVFSLLLPRLSTSSSLSLPKNTSLWHESWVPYAQKRGTATEAKQMTFAWQICLSTLLKVKSEVAQPLELIVS